MRQRLLKIYAENLALIIKNEKKTINNWWILFLTCTQYITENYMKGLKIHFYFFVARFALARKSSIDIHILLHTSQYLDQALRTHLERDFRSY